jgi:hypothetical protein
MPTNDNQDPIDAEHKGLHRQAIYNFIATISDMPKELIAKASPEKDPKLANLLAALQERQMREADKFLNRLERESPNPLRHEQEYDTQARKFKEEMERYLRQYTKGIELAEQMRSAEKQEGFDHDLSE